MLADLVGGALAPLVGNYVGFEADSHTVFEGASFDDFVNSLKRAAAHEQYVVRAYLEKVLVWMLAPALRRDVSDAAFDYLEERLLHPFA